MTTSDNDRIAPSSPDRPSGRPGSHPGKLLTTLLVLPAALLLLTPFALLATAAAAQPDVLSVLVHEPRVAVQLTVGLVISVLFCTLPFSRITARPAGREARPADEAPAPAAASADDADAEAAHQPLAA